MALQLQSLYGADKVKILKRPGKMGLGSAYIDGLALASGDFIFIMDADLSHHVRAQRVQRVAGCVSRADRCHGGLILPVAFGTHYSTPVRSFHPRTLLPHSYHAFPPRPLPQPKEIPRYIAKQREGNFDVVSGTRYVTGGWAQGGGHSASGAASTHRGSLMLLLMPPPPKPPPHSRAPPLQAAASTAGICTASWYPAPPTSLRRCC